MSDTVTRLLPYVAIVNLTLVALLLLLLGRMAVSRPLTELPDGVQNAAEAVLDWFVAQARGVDPRRVTLIAPFLATLFLLILGSNLLALLPIPILQIPPTAYFGVPLGLALVAVLGVMVIAASIRGVQAVAEAPGLAQSAAAGRRVEPYALTFPAIVWQHRRGVHRVGAGRAGGAVRHPTDYSRARPDPGRRCSRWSSRCSP